MGMIIGGAIAIFCIAILYIIVGIFISSFPIVWGVVLTYWIGAIFIVPTAIAAIAIMCIYFADSY